MNKNQKPILWIVIAVVVAAIIGAAVWLLVFRKGGSKASRDDMVKKFTEDNCKGAADKDKCKKMSECIVDGTIDIAGAKNAKKIFIDGAKVDDLGLSADQKTKLSAMTVKCGLGSLVDFGGFGGLGF